MAGFLIIATSHWYLLIVVFGVNAVEPLFCTSHYTYLYKSILTGINMNGFYANNKELLRYWAVSPIPLHHEGEAS